MAREIAVPDEKTITMQGEMARESIPLDLHWVIHGPTTDDLIEFLEAVQISVNSVAYQFLREEDLQEDARRSPRLVDLKIVDVSVGSFKFKFEFEWTRDPQSEPLVRQIRNGILKKVIIGWVSALLLAGAPQADPSSHPQVTPQMREGVDPVIAVLARTEKPSSLLIIDPVGGGHAFISPGDVGASAPLRQEEER